MNDDFNISAVWKIFGYESEEEMEKEHERKRVEADLPDYTSEIIKSFIVTDISFWLDRIPKEIKMPKTEIIIPEIHGYDFFQIIESKNTVQWKKDAWERDVIAVQKAAQKIGYPVFLKSGLISDKHSWNCVAMDDMDLRNKMYTNMELIGRADFILESWAVREFHTNTNPAFISNRKSGMPVNKERRYFFENGKVIAHMPYWIEEAFQLTEDEALILSYKKDFRIIQEVTGWEEKLKLVNTETEEEIKYLTGLTELVAQNFVDTNIPWSVDWMWTTDGWLLIDMADGRRSWGYEDIKNEN